ncbi:peptidoglycan-binding protein [Streptomyces sp. Lzd4kr]|nr:peptidoglycan-binding protein [Streptomyces sp. Lzd4kr]
MSTTQGTEPASQPADAPENGETPRAGRSRRGRRRKGSARVALGLVTAAALTATVVVGRQQGWLGDQGGGDDRPAPPAATATVERTSLSTGMDLKGTIGYGQAQDAVGRGNGTLTALRRPGETVRPGQWIWERDGIPVPYFRGERPLWRVLKKGTEGKDVRDLKRNLIDLGYANGLGLSADDTFTAGTETAVKRWQKRVGAPRTGQVDPAAVVMLDLPRLRVLEAPGVVGSPPAGTALLKVTGTALVATAKVTYDQMARLSPGASLNVSLPGGRTVRGKVTSLNIGGQDESGQDSGDGKQQAAVTVSLTDQKAAASAGPGPATLTVTDRKADKVLAVPVTALLALAEGGYGVEVVGADGRTRTVPVTIGLVADARAEITKGEVREGTKVVIPE